MNNSAGVTSDGSSLEMVVVKNENNSHDPTLLTLVLIERLLVIEIKLSQETFSATVI